MTKQYLRGDDGVFYATFLDQTGGDSAIVTDPVITITHYNGATVVTDISAQPMVQIGSSNQYYFVWSIPPSADLATYLVTYNADVDGFDLEADEHFQVQPPKSEGGDIV